jgi:hypothetical protein
MVKNIVNRLSFIISNGKEWFKQQPGFHRFNPLICRCIIKIKEEIKKQIDSGD